MIQLNICKIYLPDASAKTVKIPPNATIEDACNAMLNRLDKRTARQDFNIFCNDVLPRFINSECDV